MQLIAKAEFFHIFGYVTCERPFTKEAEAVNLTESRRESERKGDR